MKRSWMYCSLVCLGLVVAFFLSVANTAAAAPDSDLVGKWKLQATMGGDTKDYDIEFKNEEGKLSGVLYTPDSGDAIPLSNLEYKDGALKFTVSAPDGDYPCEATVSGKKMTGHFKTPGGQSGDFEATKAEA